MVQLHADGGAAERAGGRRGADGLAAAARPAAHGGGAMERGQRREAAPGGEAAHQAARAGGGHGGGGGDGANRAARATPAVVLARVRGRARQPAPVPHVQPPLLGEQEAPGLGRLPRHLLAGRPRPDGAPAPRTHRVACEVRFVILIIWYSFHNNVLVIPLLYLLLFRIKVLFELHCT